MNIDNSGKYKQKEDLAELEELEGLDTEQLKKKAQKEFNITEEEWDEKVKIDPMFTKNTVDDIASINKYFADRLENTLAGRRLITTGKNEEKWVQHEKAIAGSLLIKSCVGIISTFANKSMLISGTKEQDFNMQFEDAFRKISDLIVMPQTYVDVNSIRAILKQFKDTFWNLGAILTRTGKNMDAYFSALKGSYEDADNNLKSKLSE